MKKLKIFEAVVAYADEDGGRRRIEALCTPALDAQVDAWLAAAPARELCVPGPVTVATTVRVHAGQQVVVETRHMPILYTDHASEGSYDRSTNPGAVESNTTRIDTGREPGGRVFPAGGLIPPGGGRAGGVPGADTEPRADTPAAPAAGALRVPELSDY